MPLSASCTARRARGLALLVMLVIVLLVAMTGIVAQLAQASRALPTVRDALAHAVLEEAKHALVAFAAENRNRPGGLPCPDLDGDGHAELACDSPERRVGLLPWQTLRVGELRDASGAALWYAVSEAFRNDANVAINSFSAPTLRLDGGGERAVAIVIAPGPARADQARSQPSAAARGAYLEGKNARGVVEFEHFADRERGNDRVAALTAGELMRVVEPVVAARVRREIAPLLLERYVAKWGRFPFAVPIVDPRSAPLVDAANRSAHEGFLPASADPHWVHWDRASLRVRELGPNGRGIEVDCTRSLTTEIRCTIDHAGATRIAIEADAVNVGYALVEPPSTEPNDFGPATLNERSIEIGRVRADGRASVVAYATLPENATRTRVHLQAPSPIRELTDARLPVATRHAWFARNQWQRTLAYLVSPAHSPSAAGDSGCSRDENCVVLRADEGPVLAPAGMVLAGQAVLSIPPSKVAAQAPPRTVVPLCAAAEHACGALR